MPLTQEELFMQEMERQRQRMEKLKEGIEALGDMVNRMEGDFRLALRRFHEKVNSDG